MVECNLIINRCCLKPLWRKVVPIKSRSKILGSVPRTECVCFCIPPIKCLLSPVLNPCLYMLLTILVGLCSVNQMASPWESFPLRRACLFWVIIYSPLPSLVGMGNSSIICAVMVILPHVVVFPLSDMLWQSIRALTRSGLWTQTACECGHCLKKMMT